MTYPKALSAQMLAELGEYVIAEPFPFVADLEKCRGMTLVTVDGDEICDWGGIYGSKLIGYNHPRMMTDAYAREVLIAANTKIANPDILTRQCLDYYRLLHRLRPKCMRQDVVEVYAVNSGAEAVENMMKYFINLFHHRQAAAKKPASSPRFIYFDQAFHGRTVYALNVTTLKNDPIATRDFQGIIAGNLQVQFPALHTRLTPEENDEKVTSSLESLEGLLSAHQGEIAGVILEPLQGAGGHRLAPARFYTGLSELCHKYDVPWGLDEVQTSGGQTGEIFCIDNFAIPYPPQAVATAKKFGNGVVYMRQSMQDVGVLDSTWGGSLTDMVRFVHEWQIVEDEKLIEQVPAKTGRLLTGLHMLEERFPAKMCNVRGLGLYQGFNVLGQGNKGRLIEMALQEENYLLLGAGTYSVRLRPPLDVTESQIDALIAMLVRLFERL